VNGLRVVPFNLYASLRVESVIAENGQSLSFIQEDKNDDAELFSVILPQALAAGEAFTLTTTYSGKDAVLNEGSGNYYPNGGARESWYPNNPDSLFGEYTAYDLTFRIPKGMQMVATGTMVSENKENNQSVSVWKSEGPITVAGFNFGQFKREEAKLDKLGYVVQSYANREPPNWVRAVQHYANSDLPIQGPHTGPDVALGTMDTTSLNKKALAEAQVALQLYTDYFGPAPCKQLAVTQQTATDYGQSWPGLVYLPITYFFDTTTRHSLVNLIRERCPTCFAKGDDPYGYFKVVAPHEVAHQWWGHKVGFNSYRDQWMSEGFSDMSASLFIQLIEKDPKKFIEFWNDEREMLVERNKEGFRAIDAGPVTMGYRLSNTRSGFDITRRLIYPKGAYILHMIRMMMWDRQTGDQNFKQTMQDFAQTFAGRAATTEDFKAIVEKHMTRGMDLDGNHKMDWFFNEYVYGTALPSYKLDYTFENAPDGNTMLGFKLTQSNVDANFRMLVPVYLELADGRSFNLGRVTLVGNSSFEQKVPLKGLKDKPRRALVNYYDDVLASAN
jgi:hypothetical protein